MASLTDKCQKSILLIGIKKQIKIKRYKEIPNIMVTLYFSNINSFFFEVFNNDSLGITYIIHISIKTQATIYNHYSDIGRTR